MRYYIGFDQALANTGWAVGVVNDIRLKETKPQVTVVESGVFTTVPSDLNVERLAQIYTFVSKLLEEYNPEFIFTEAVFQQRTKNNDDLLKVEAVLHLAAYQHGCRFCIIPSSGSTNGSWRTILGIGKGKQTAQAFIKEVWDRQLKTSHEAEAICLFLTGLIKLEVLDKANLASIIFPVLAESNLNLTNAKSSTKTKAA
jgi:Holliday junction resolvasome RuvABC endonuclease subunit